MQFAERVRESTLATSMDFIPLMGAATGYLPFFSPTTFQAGANVLVEVSIGDQWEVGTYRVEDSNHLTRLSVVASSSNNGPVTFQAGQKRVRCISAQFTLDPVTGSVVGLVDPTTGSSAPVGGGGMLQVIGAQTVGSVLIAKYASGTGTIRFTRTTNGVTSDIGTDVASGSTYTVLTTDRGGVIGARSISYTPAPANGLTIPTVAPLAPTITNITPGPSNVTVALTRNADNGGDTVMYDRVDVYGFASDTMVGYNTGASPIIVSNLPAGLDVYAKAATYGLMNGLGPYSDKSAKVTTSGGGGSSTPPPVSGTIGPYTLGNAYNVGGRSYYAMTGDDFDALSYVSPGNPAGKYGTTRAYMSALAGNGPRGNTSASNSLKGYDGDPLHTGYNDANRGAAMTSLSDTMTVNNSRLILKSRVATAPEKALFANPSGMPVASAMLNTATSHLVMAPFAVECKMKLTKSQASMGGWHPSFWMMQAKSVTSYTSTELDWEGDSLRIAPNKFAWTSGSNTSSGGTAYTYNSGTEYTFRIEVLADGSVNFYSNIASGGGPGALNQVRTLAPGAVADTSRPHYVMLTNHVADFASDPYADADWVAAGSAGATMDVDYFALLTGAPTLYQPLVPMQTVNVDYGVPINIALPSAATVWGADVTEDIESWVQESNEPGGDYAGGYLNKVPGLTYDLAALTVSGTPIPSPSKPGSLNRSGRIMICRYTKVSGTACIPHRTIVNVGPHLTVDALPAATVGSPYSYDLYAQADCGALVSNSSGQRAKTVGVTGLPAGLAYNDTTGLITGTPSAPFTANLTVTITNSVGQTAVGTAVFNGFTQNQGATAPTLTGSPTVRNSWDFDKLSTLTLDNSGASPVITAVAPSDGGALTLANATLATAPTRVLRSNNRYAALFSKAAAQFLQGSAAQTAGGTIAIVFEPISITSTMQAFERSKAASGTTTNREGMISVANTYVAARRGSSSGTVADAQSTSAQNTTTLHVAVMVFDPASTTITMYLDGANVGTTGTTGQASGMDTVTMGARMASSALGLPYDGYIYRVIDYPVALTAAQAEQVAVWARQNYGTPNLA